MFKEMSQVFQDKNGQFSSMRVGTFICICTACYVSIIGVKLGTDLVGLSTIIGVLLGAGIGGKVMQKGKE